MDNRNFPRRTRKQTVGRGGVAEFINRQGVYLVLFVCLAIIGVTAYFTMGQSNDVAQAPSPSPQGQAAANPQVPTLDEEIKRLQQAASPTPAATATPAPTATPSPTPAATATPAAKQTAILPVQGEVLRGFSAKDPVFFPTLNQWMVHKATDIQAAEGTEVKAALDGTVKSVGNDAETGYTIVLEHDGGIQTVYGNLQAPENIKKGQTVQQGDVIGKVGKSAANVQDDPAHLHFAYLVKGTAKDPMKVCK